MTLPHLIKYSVEYQLHDSVKYVGFLQRLVLEWCVVAFLTVLESTLRIVVCIAVICLSLLQVMKQFPGGPESPLRGSILLFPTFTFIGYTVNGLSLWPIFRYFRTAVYSVTLIAQHMPAWVQVCACLCECVCLPARVAVCVPAFLCVCPLAWVQVCELVSGF